MLNISNNTATMPRSCLLGRAVMVVRGTGGARETEILLLDARDIFYR
jgi:hypothetical protein